MPDILKDSHGAEVEVERLGAEVARLEWLYGHMLEIADFRRREINRLQAEILQLRAALRRTEV